MQQRLDEQTCVAEGALWVFPPFFCEGSREELGLRGAPNRAILRLAMGLSKGTKLGPYEILASLGTGGMGEVYRARDSRLDRTVAIKILPESHSTDPLRRQRFEQEARAVSNLNHPHICTVHDVGHQDGVDYIVMECVEGETLAKRLEKGPLPVDQVLRYGIQIADALDKAHRSGVVHRDLKPANIMLTPTGAKLLDFGLAKVFTSPDAGAAAQAAGLTASLHASADAAAAGRLSPVTQEGTVVGTYRYMSPEQVEGKEVDARSDIFSLGAVLYEALTGRRAFDGKSQWSAMSAILEKEPERIATVKPATPPALEHAIRGCLAKDREGRWQSARDLVLELKWAAENGSAGATNDATGSRHRLRAPLGWVVAALAVLAALALGIHDGLQPSAHPRAQMVRSSLLPAGGSAFLPYHLALSPSGDRLAYVALGADGKTSLWLRSLASPVAQQLSGTDGASYPFWSPDNLHVGFFADGRLKAIDLVDSTIHVFWGVPSGFGGTWNQDGTIVFAPGITGPLFKIAAGGGTAEAIGKIAAGSSESRHWPSFLPDGKHFLYFANWTDSADGHGNGIYVGSLDGAEPKLISSELEGNVYFSSGYLTYVRDRRVMAQPFDADRLETTGVAASLTQQEVEQFSDFRQSAYSVSRDGKLVFQSAADAPTRLVWYDAAGREQEQFPEIGYAGPQFSPDGRFLASSSDDERNGRRFIRVYDMARGVSSRLTEQGDEEYPAWSRDGKMIAFRDSSLNIEVMPADGSGSPRTVVKGVNAIPCDWSADGELVYMVIARGSPFPELDTYSSRDQSTTLLSKVGAEPQFSPDGKWIAYVGLPMREIVVQPFPGSGAHIQISNTGNSTQPRWSRDGKQVFYIDPHRKLIGVSFDEKTGTASAPRVVAQTRVVATSFAWFQYDVAPDGRFLVNSLPASNSAPLTLETGWDASLQRR